MDNDQAHEMLARIDERLKEIQERIKPMSCLVHQEKIKTLEKIVWGVLLGVTGLFISSVWGVITK